MFLRDALTSERQCARARDKACGSFAGLGGHVTGAQDGLWVVEGPVATVRTGVAAEPDHTGKPQLLQHLLEPGVQVRQAAQVDGAVHVLVALQGRGVQHVAQLAQPHGVAQQALQHSHRDGVAAEAEGGELGAVAQGGQEGAELGVHDATLVQVQVLEGGRGLLDQDPEGLGAYAGQVDPAEAQIDLREKGDVKT